jgi:acyl-CoA synthetase (AMP-forming)/AMP-acid ligase II
VSEIHLSPHWTGSPSRPQCSPPAILNLHTTTSSVRTIYHPKYSALAEDTRRLDPSIKLVEMTSGALTLKHEEGSIPTIDDVSIDPDSVSHVFHSSGTSGLPKPIPNTHARSVNVLPRRALPSYLSSTGNSSSSSNSPPPPSESAAFTTTPLFHGGVSDLLRAWMARSMVYFYPTSDVPITMKNVVAAVQACQAPPPDLPTLPNLTGALLVERENRFKPTAFLSVPYILSTLVEDLEGDGMRMLQSMDYVSTGGAPLDTSIGDAMVERGVRLVSRLGSSECGCESIQLPI